MKLGCFILRPPSAVEALRRFRLAETVGYDSAFATHVNGADAPTLLGAAAAVTERVELGSGVIPIYTRTPTTMAQSAATLWDLSGGRIRLGLGLGHRAVMKPWHDEDIERPVAEMREYIAIMRGVLDGKPISETQKWASEMPLVEVEGTGMPLLIGALSPRMLRLSGEIGQGLVLWMTTPKYVAETVVPSVREGRERIGLTMDGFEIVASIPAAEGESPAHLRRLYVAQIANNLRLPFYRRMLERGGYQEEINAIEEADRYETLLERIPQEALDVIADGRFVADVMAIGGADEVAEKLAEYGRAGVTVAGVNPVQIDRFDETISFVASSLGRAT